MSRPVTICGLFYGDHPDVANRCLTSLSRVLPGPVVDIRLALNDVSMTSRRIIEEWSAEVARGGIPVRLFWSTANRFKYPMMRRMFRQVDRPLAPLVMWLDDDTWFDPAADEKWWDAALAALRGAEMVGQFWRFPFPLTRQRFFKTMPWWGNRPIRRHNGSPVSWFIQGAWWLARSKTLLKYDWPHPALRHCGGDSMLGELLYQQDLPTHAFDSLLHINADATGRKSSAPRRGHTERPLGFDYIGDPPDTSHQAFPLVTKDYYAGPSHHYGPGPDGGPPAALSRVAGTPQVSDPGGVRHPETPDRGGEAAPDLADS